MNVALLALGLLAGGCLGFWLGMRQSRFVVLWTPEEEDDYGSE